MTGGRFRDNGDGTVTDTSTGLMWMKQRFPVSLPYNDEGFKVACEYCKTLYLGFRDWRLPTLEELHILYRATRKERYALFRWEPDFYWCTFTEVSPFTGNLDYPNERIVTKAHLLNFEDGRSAGTRYILPLLRGYVRPVRREHKNSK